MQMQGVPGSQGVPGAQFPPPQFSPFIYGNDVDSVDVATRVAMVSDQILVLISPWLKTVQNL